MDRRPASKEWYYRPLYLSRQNKMAGRTSWYRF